MPNVPRHYESLEIEPSATQQQIEDAYRARVTALQRSRITDAEEELAEVEDAYSVLREPRSRAAYDAELAQEEALADAKFAELDKSLPQHHRHKHVDGTSGILGAISSFFTSRR